MPGTWRRQWVDWYLLKPKKIYQMDELERHENKFADPSGLHKALDENDMDYYHKFIPKEDIDFALKMVSQQEGMPNG
jgi:hypothetical protein